MPVPLFATTLEPHREQIVARLADVVASGRYILGPQVAAFEEEFAEYCGTRFCVGVANGTDALTIALRALGIRPGDEVVLPSFTFYATAEAAVNAGAVPVFCDVDPATFCVTLESVSAAMTERTRAIIPVHLFGRLADTEDLRGLGVPVLADAAQAAGATRAGAAIGTLSDAATFSFFPSKNLPCIGDGGAIVTDREDVADMARQLRFHGSRDKVTHELIGYNSRLDELQAAVLRLLLPELDGWNAARRRTAGLYTEHGLGDLVEIPDLGADREHVFHLYVVRHERADELKAVLEARGIGARAYYRRPIHLQPAFDETAARRLEPEGKVLALPGTTEAARTHLALPMGTELDVRAVSEVIEACASGLT
ncbi:MAG: DegT/DnrJ/EryC1/StrS family aminotransferase [Thermoleophilaceae bacterium]